MNLGGHRLVPVSRDLDFRVAEGEDNESGWRCAACGLRGKWQGDIIFDRPCTQPAMFEDGAA